ncbi:MAG TPA: HAMP domain-containing histidine kinase [Candidatus Luteococcus avicola]|nr:HAMP domain-containing histidine kinase [Candidatus Luteococcus avicola]
MRRLGLRWSVALAVWLAVVAGIGTAGVLADRAARAGIAAEQANLEGVLGTLEMNLAWSATSPAPQSIAKVLGQWGMSDVLVPRNGQWVSIASNPLDLPQECLPALSEVEVGTLPPNESMGRPLALDCGDRRVLAAWSTSASTGTYLVAVVTTPPNYAPVNLLRRQLLWTGGAASLLAALGAWWISGVLTAPVRRAGRFARRFAAGDRDVRLPVDGRDDLAAMSVQFNAMADEVNRTLSAQQHFISDTAHELRTPTAGMLATASALENPATRDRAALLVAPQLRRLTALTEDLLSLSRFDAATERLDLQRVDLADVVRHAVAEAGSTDIVVDAFDPVEVDCDPVRVRAIVRNLVVNGLRHGAAPVQVQVTDGGSRSASVRVRDHGAGVPAELRATVFDRFVQGDESRHGEGSGLGLAIAREQARLHGGDLVLEDDGRTFRLDLPVGRLDAYLDAGPDDARADGHSKPLGRMVDRLVKALFFIGVGLGTHAVWVALRPYRDDPVFLERLHSPARAGTWLFSGWVVPVQLGWLAGALVAWAVLATVLRRAGRVAAALVALALVGISFVLPAPAAARILPFLAIPVALLLVGGGRSRP